MKCVAPGGDYIIHSGVIEPLCGHGLFSYSIPTFLLLQTFVGSSEWDNFREGWSCGPWG